MPAPSLGRALATALALASAVSLVAWLSREGVEAPLVQRVVIEGNHHASEVALRHLADVRVGQSLLSLNLTAVVERVSRHPWVDEVTVSRDLTGGVRVRVTEHESAMLLAHDGLFRVSPEGEIFIRARSADLDLPVLTGLDAELVTSHAEVADRVVRYALETLAALSGRTGLAPDDLSEIHFDRDLGFTLILRSGSRVRLGFGRPDPRLDRLDAIVRRGLNLNVPHEVDLDLADMAVVTPLTS